MERKKKVTIITIALLLLLILLALAIALPLALGGKKDEGVSVSWSVSGTSYNKWYVKTGDDIKENDRGEGELEFSFAKDQIVYFGLHYTSTYNSVYYLTQITYDNTSLDLQYYIDQSESNFENSLGEVSSWKNWSGSENYMSSDGFILLKISLKEEATKANFEIGLGCVDRGGAE